MCDLAAPYLVASKASIHHVHGLDIITLCHRESEKLLFGDEEEDVLQIQWTPVSIARKADGQVHPGALWKIQLRYQELGGNAIPLQGSEVLLQHVQSSKYLCSEHGCANLSDDISSPNCLWSLTAIQNSVADSSNCLTQGKLLWLKQAEDSGDRKSWLSVEVEDSNAVNLARGHNTQPSMIGLGSVNSDALMRHGAWMDNDDLMEVSLVDCTFCNSVYYIVQCKIMFDGLIATIQDAEPISKGSSIWERVQMTLQHPVHAILKRNYGTIIGCLNYLVCSCTLSKDDDPFTRRGSPREDQQDLLRQIGFLEAAMALVASLFEDLGVPLSPVAKIPAIFQVMRRCYLLIERACLDNVKNKKVMLKHVPTMESHLEVQIGAYFAMMVIFSDTRELLESVDKERFREIVAGLKNCRSDLWARFLVQTCHEGDQPIRKNQNLLTELLLIESPELIFRTKITDDDVILASDTEDMTSFSVKTIFKDYTDEDLLFSCQDDDIRPIRGAVCQLPRDLFRYHITMMELLGWLVHGRNSWASQVLAVNASRFGLEYSQLFRIMNRREIPYIFRTRCCELIQRLYIDQDPHQTFNVLRCTRVWTGLFGGANADAFVRGIKERESQPHVHPFDDTDFSRLKTSASDLIRSCEHAERRNKPRSLFLTSLVELVQCLTKYGFYHKFDEKIRNWCMQFVEVREVSKMLISALDERTDLNSLDLTSKRKMRKGTTLNDGDSSILDHENVTVIDGKIKILDQMLTFLRLCDNERITELLTFWEIMLAKFTSQNKDSAVEDEGLLRITWMERAPWTEQDLKNLAERLFSEEYVILPIGGGREMLEPLNRPSLYTTASCISMTFGKSSNSVDSNISQFGMRLASAEPGNFKGNGANEEWCKIMLCLVRYPSHSLKELAFKGLISQCREHSHFIMSALDMQIIYSPELARVHSEMNKQIALLRRNAKYIVGGQGSSLKADAMKTWTQILSEWSALCIMTLQRARVDVVEVQDVLANLGAIDVVASILRLPMDRYPAQELGVLDLPVDEQQRDLFTVVYAFLARVCDRHKRNQQKLLPWLDLFCSHLGIEDLKVEVALSSLMRDNAEMVALMGKAWIRMFFEDVLAKYRCQRAEWLNSLHAMIRVGKKAIQEHQALTMVMFRRFEGITALFMKSDEDWDRRIDIMQGTTMDAAKRTKELDVLDYSLAVITLLSVCCEGKNPAAEVYAARYLSLEDAIRGVVVLSKRSSGEAADIPVCMSCKVTSVYLTFLHDVYSQTNVTRLVEELHRVHNGIWSCRPQDPLQHMPLMPFLLRDIEKYVSNVKLSLGLYDEAHDGKLTCRVLTETEMTSMREYIFFSVFKFMTFYFKARYSAVRGSTSNDEEITGKIYSTVRDFYNLPLTQKDLTIFLDGVPLQGRDITAELLKVIFQKARVSTGPSKRMSIFGKDLNSSYDIPSAFPMSAMHGVRVSTVKIGYRSLCEQLAAQYQIMQFVELSRIGVKKLSMLFSLEGVADLGYETLASPGSCELKKRSTYDSLLMNVMELCNHDKTETQTLIDILRLMRAALYMSEPHGPKELPPKTIETHWRAFVSDMPMVKLYGPDDEILTWLQHKFDALGSTEAALHLSAHPTCAVRTSAIRVLLTLLQTGNERNQQAVFDYFTSTKDTRFFKSAHDTISLCMESLKDLKRAMKSLKNGSIKERPDLQWIACQLEKDQMEALNMESEFGRQSEVMLTLRLIQLMCEGQFKKMQDMMQKQSVDATSFDLLRKCIDLVEAIQPLLYDSLGFNTGDLTVLCMQVVETISEAVQGPNLQNQKYILSSKFLAVVNKVLSTLTYAPVDSHGKSIGTAGLSVNDLKCWLKTSLMNCCHAILEGIGDEMRSSRALEFFELRNFEVQMESIGQLLELVDATQSHSEPTSTNGRRASIRGGGLLSKTRPLERRQNLRKGNCKRRSKEEIAFIESMHFSRGWQLALENELFGMYFLIVVMAEHDASGTIVEWLAVFQKDHQRLYQHLTGHSSHVELSRMNESEMRTEKLYFRMDPKVIELTSNLDFKVRTDKFIFDVPRENPQEKASMFLKKSKQVLLMVSLLRDVTVLDDYGLSKFFFQRRDLVDAFSRRLAAVITLCLVIMYGIPVDPNTGHILGDGKFYTVGHSEPWYKDECYAHANKTSHPSGPGASIASIMDDTDLSLKFRLRLESRWRSPAEWQAFPLGRYILLVLAFLHVCTTVINSIIQLTLDFPLLCRECMEQEGALDDEPEDADIARARLLRGKAPVVGLKKPLEAMPPMQSLQSEIIFSRNVRKLLFRSISATWYLAFKLCISLLGLYNSPFFYPVYLLDFFRSSIGHMVLKAIVVGGPNLFRSFILSMIVIICFGFNSYAFFSQSVNVNQQLCHSPFQCVVKHILDSMTGDLTTVLGNDHGDFAYPSVAPWQDLWHTWRYFTIFLSLIFWVFLLLGIMQGQIIDAFAEMRDKDKAARDDLSNNCFISSIDRHSFSGYQGEWEKRKDGKFAWNYLHFFCYLQQKDPEEYSGLENTVSEAYAKGSTDFLPIGKFYAGQRSDVDKGDATREMLESYSQEAKEKMVKQEKTIAQLQSSNEENLRLIRDLHSALERQTEIMEGYIEKKEYSRRSSLLTGVSSPFFTSASPRNSVAPIPTILDVSLPMTSLQARGGRHLSTASMKEEEVENEPHCNLKGGKQ